MALKRSGLVTREVTFLLRRALSALPPIDPNDQDPPPILLGALISNGTPEGERARLQLRQWMPEQFAGGEVFELEELKRTLRWFNGQEAANDAKRSQ